MVENRVAEINKAAVRIAREKCLRRSRSFLSEIESLDAMRAKTF
jgi:hypothetical protein